MDDFNLVKKKLINLIDFDFFDKAVISNPLKKGEGICFKAVLSKTEVRRGQGVQIAYFIDQKVVHENIGGDEETGDIKNALIDKILDIMSDNFKQCNLSSNRIITLLMNKKKQFKITENKENKNPAKNSVSHNAEKNYIIKEGVYADWLFEVGLIDKNGNVHNSMQKKFRQINRFVEIVSDIEKYVPDNGVIVDMGCGKSYLTFAMYYYFNILKNKNLCIKGYDLKKDVVDKCNEIW